MKKNTLLKTLKLIKVDRHMSVTTINGFFFIDEIKAN